MRPVGRISVATTRVSGSGACRRAPSPASPSLSEFKERQQTLCGVACSAATEAAAASMARWSHGVVLLCFIWAHVVRGPRGSPTAARGGSLCGSACARLLRPVRPRTCRGRRISRSPGATARRRSAGSARHAVGSVREPVADVIAVIALAEKLAGKPAGRPAQGRHSHTLPPCLMKSPASNIAGFRRMSTGIIARPRFISRVSPAPPPSITTTPRRTRRRRRWVGRVADPGYGCARSTPLSRATRRAVS